MSESTDPDLVIDWPTVRLRDGRRVEVEVSPRMLWWIEKRTGTGQKFIAACREEPLEQLSWFFQKLLKLQTQDEVFDVMADGQLREYARAVAMSVGLALGASREVLEQRLEEGEREALAAAQGNGSGEVQSQARTDPFPGEAFSPSPSSATTPPSSSGTVR